MSFGNYQLEIYLQGLTGVLPTLPMSFDELEARAEAGTFAVDLVLCRRWRRRRADPADQRHRFQPAGA